MKARVLDILAQRRRLLLSQVSGVPAVDGHGDLADQTDAARLNAAAAATRSRQFEQLRAIDMAEQRVRDGEYGICLTCELPISPKRLEAIPEALYCVRCQAALELEARRNGGPAYGDGDEDAC